MALRAQKPEGASLFGRTESSPAAPSQGPPAQVQAQKDQEEDESQISKEDDNLVDVKSEGLPAQVQAQEDGDGHGDPTDEEDEENEGESIVNPPAAAQVGLVGNDTLTAVNPPARTCIACFKHINPLEAARTPCNHDYCRNCIEAMFENVIENRSQFPARCCGQPIPLLTAQPLLRPGLIPLYERKQIESETVDKTYCSNARCSRFLYGNDIQNERATCGNCRTVTCTRCKAFAHTGRCGADPGLRQVLDAARQNRWQQCYSCHQLVERIEGCTHMRLVFSLLTSRIQTNQITVTGAGAVLASAITVGNAGRKTAAAVMSACLYMQHQGPTQWSLGRK